MVSPVHVSVILV